MVKILLVDNGEPAAHYLIQKYREMLQIDLVTVSSITEGIDRTRLVAPDVICIPLPGTDSPDYSLIVSWYQNCKTDGLYCAFYLFALFMDNFFLFDITSGISRFPVHSPDIGHMILISVRQATGRSKVERSLRDDYDHHNRIINKMPLCCLDVENGLITRINPQFSILMGYDEHQILGRSIRDFVSHDISSHNLVSAGGDTITICDGIIRTDKDTGIPCRITIDQKPAGMEMDGLWFIEDRREYAAITTALRETEYECREQLYLSETLVIRLQPTGMISFANPAAVRCFGYEKEDSLIGLSINSLFPPGTIPDSTSPSEMFLEIADESSPSIHIFEHRKKDGHRLWIAWTSRGIYSSLSELTGIICIGTDMTEHSSTGTERISTRVWRDRVIESTDILPEVFDAVLQACMEIGREGREGKAVGTSFLVGDHPEVMKQSRQLILNPFQGHPPEFRNVSSPDVREMLKEYALLDGAFVVSGEGLLEAAGRYITLDTSSVSLSKGMGTRHSSVAALTGVTHAIGFVVSESGGRVSIMKNGKIIRVIA